MVRLLARIVVALLAAQAGAALADTRVTFVEPEKFTDAGYDERDALQTRTQIERHLQKLGARYLPAGTDLSIDVLDIDLAGRQRLSVRHPELRIVKGRADWPAFKLRYTLSEGGKTIASGEDRLADLAYQDRGGSYARSEPMRYEMRMLDDWFKARFAKHPQSTQ